MTIHTGLDVNDKSTHIWVVDDDGAVLHRDVVAIDPAVLAKLLGKHYTSTTLRLSIEPATKQICWVGLS